MTTQERISVIRALEMLVRDVNVHISVRQAADRSLTVHEAAIQTAALEGDPVAQAFRLSCLQAAHSSECDDRCHACTFCYQHTGNSVCDKLCPHATLEDFDE